MNRQIDAFKYSIVNQADGEVEVNIDGDIVDASTQAMIAAWFGDETSTSFKSFRDQVEAADPKKLTVYINSQGGMVTDAMAIHDYLVGLASKGVVVNTVGRGLIASAATFILLAGGKNSRITSNSWFMIHNASGMVYGNVNEIENYAKAIRSINDKVTKNYAKATGKSEADIAEMMNQETWLSGDDAVEQKFVSALLEEAPFENRISASAWQYSNTAILNSYNASVGKKPAAAPAPSAGIIATLRSELKTDFMHLSADLKKLFKNAKDDKKTDKVPFKQDVLDLVSSILTPFAAKVDEALEEKADDEEVVDPKKADKKKKTDADDTEGAEGDEGADGEGEGEGEDGDGEEADDKKAGDAQAKRIAELEAALDEQKKVNARLKKVGAKQVAQPSTAKTGKTSQKADGTEPTNYGRFLKSQ